MFFIASKVFWVVARPLTLLLLTLVLGLGLRRFGWPRTGGAFVGLALAGFAVFEYTSLGAILLLPLENRFAAVSTLPEDVTGIIVLGGAVNAGTTAQERNQVLLNGGAERMTEAVVLARRLPDARIAFAGHSGALFHEGWTESDLARRFFTSMGLDEDRVVYEDQSRNTAQNAAYLRRLIDPAPDETWLMVTSAAHMPRAVGCFRKVGWEVTPYPVDFTLPPEVAFKPITGGGLNAIGAALHEWMGLLAYRLTGRIETLFPAPEPPGRTENG